MLETFKSYSPVFQAFIATIFTWSMTALGSAAVFFSKKPNRKLLDTSLGFAAGIMIAASFWSLLLPALELSEKSGLPSWLPVSIGFVLGALSLRILDALVPHLHINFPEDKKEGLKTKLKKPVLLVLAITIHNFPEGLAIGVAFASVGTQSDLTVIGSIALALGIGIQNIPEGTAVSLPLHSEGIGKWKSFNYGQMSGLMEIFGGIIGAATVSVSETILPYALAYAAGAMIYVVIEEVIPESQSGQNTDLATLGAILGFLIMMILDTAF